MKVRIVVAATKEEAANTLKISAPRKVKVRHSGDSEWKAQQKKAKVYYRKNKATLGRKKKLYTKRHATQLAKRARFLKTAPKAKVVSPGKH